MPDEQLIERFTSCIIEIEEIQQEIIAIGKRLKELKIELENLVDELEK